jgi:hypothetical protein
VSLKREHKIRDTNEAAQAMVLTVMHGGKSLVMKRNCEISTQTTEISFWDRTKTINITCIFKKSKKKKLYLNNKAEE